MSTAYSQLLVASSAVTHDLGLSRRLSISQVLLSRIIVLLLSVTAVFAALFGTREIFSQVLFAWAAMGSAFGPLLLMQVFGGKIGPRWRLASILLGFGSSVLAFYLIAPSALWKGSVERVFSFCLAFAVVWIGLLLAQRAKTP
jgi:sodium/proline symporter